MIDEEFDIFDESEQERDLKKRVSIWLRASTRKKIDEIYQIDGCRSKSDFVERAIAFYSGYVLSNKSDSYLPNVITSSLKSIVKESDNRLGRLIFKLAVELAITMNIVAFNQGVDKEVLRTLRGECIKEVKKTNGIFTFDEADNWQKGL